MPKSESILKNTIECNLYPSDGPGKPNSIFMKTVKTKWASQNHFTTSNLLCIDKDWPKSKNVKVRVNTEESAVKPEPELKNTIECNLYPSDGPGKPNSIIMKTVKTVKTKWALNQFQQPICVQLTKTVKTLKAQS
ncbi:hypothetical protein Tco_0188961 [Tanacetum coccineum]